MGRWYLCNGKFGIEVDRVFPWVEVLREIGWVSVLGFCGGDGGRRDVGMLHLDEDYEGFEVYA